MPSSQATHRIDRSLLKPSQFNFPFFPKLHPSLPYRCYSQRLPITPLHEISASMSTSRKTRLKIILGANSKVRFQKWSHCWVLASNENLITYLEHLRAMIYIGMWWQYNFFKLSLFYELRIAKEGNMKLIGGGYSS